jgi:hypothetical protein
MLSYFGLTMLMECTVISQFFLAFIDQQGLGTLAPWTGGFADRTLTEGKTY